MLRLLKGEMSDIGLEPMTSSLSSWRSNQTELIAQKTNIKVSDIGLEPMTSSLSSWRSNQTELIAQINKYQSERYWTRTNDLQLVELAF